MVSSVCIYCGSNGGSPEEAYRPAARAMTRALARRGIALVYGGGFRGLMGEVASVALEEGVPLTGVVPARFRAGRAEPPAGARVLFVETMQERKETMRSLADAFVALPGGIGTLDEVVETLMLRSLGFHSKPVGFLNVGGYFDSLLSLFGSMTDSGFMHGGFGAFFHVSRDPEELAVLLAGGRS